MSLNQKSRNNCETIVLVIIVLSMIVLAGSFFKQNYSYQRYVAQNVRYERAVVRDVIEQEIKMTGSNGEYVTGYQSLLLEFLEGGQKGEEIIVNNSITLDHNIMGSVGQRVIVCADRPEGITPYYTIFNYDRSIEILIIIIAFCGLIVLVGRVKGVRSCIALGFSISMIVCFMLPQLYSGASSFWILLITIAICSVVSCFCISGFEIKTFCNMLSTFLGGISAGLVYAILSQLLHISAGTMDDAESLQLISQTTGLSIKGVLFAGIIIAAFGAVMDVAVSIGAALWEIKEFNHKVTRKELFKSGMNIGQDMIGTMANTLILAFVGGSISTLLVFISYGVKFHQLVSSNFLAMEIVQGISGTTAVILTVPISALVCSFMFCKKK